MIAPHSFGHTISTENLITNFNRLSRWEDRYRYLIALSKELPPLPTALRSDEIAISGCENRVWLGCELLNDGTLHFYGDSEGRIVRGLLAILLTAIEGKTPQQLLATDPLKLFDSLSLRDQLSASRENGLQALAAAVKTVAAHYANVLP